MGSSKSSVCTANKKDKGVQTINNTHSGQARKLDNSKSNVDEYKLVVVEKNLLKLRCFKCGVLFIGEPKRIAGFYCFYVRYEAQCLSCGYKSKWENGRLIDGRVSNINLDFI